MELYEKIQSPITSKLEKLEHKMEDVAVPFMYDRMMNQNQLSVKGTATSSSILFIF